MANPSELRVKDALKALGALTPVRLKLVVANLTDIDMQDQVVLPGDEIRLSVVARCVSALVSEKFDPKRGEFIGPLAYTARAVATDASVVSLRKRSEIDADFVKRVRTAELR